MRASFDRLVYRPQSVGLIIIPDRAKRTDFYFIYLFFNSKNIFWAKRIFVIFQTKRFLLFYFILFYFFLERENLGNDMAKNKNTNNMSMPRVHAVEWRHFLSFRCIITFFSLSLSLSFFGWVGTCLVCRFGTNFKDPRQVGKKKVSSSTRFSFVFFIFFYFLFWKKWRFRSAV